MTRDEVALYVSERLGAYLSATSRAATDSGAGGLTPAIDDALRALGYAAADIPTAAPTDAADEEDLRVQTLYRVMLQVVRDMGATLFDLSTGVDSFKLSQLRAAAEKDLALAASAVLERFGTVGIVASDSDSPFVTIDLNYLQDDLCEAAS